MWLLHFSRMLSAFNKLTAAPYPLKRLQNTARPSRLPPSSVPYRHGWRKLNIFVFVFMLELLLVQYVGWNFLVVGLGDICQFEFSLVVIYLADVMFDFPPAFVAWCNGLSLWISMKTVGATYTVLGCDESCCLICACHYNFWNFRERTGRWSKRYFWPDLLMQSSKSVLGIWRVDLEQNAVEVKNPVEYQTYFANWLSLY